MPNFVILTTPNKEFNIYFVMKNKFRHADHKFEWTREQFINWSYKICKKYGKLNLVLIYIFYFIHKGYKIFEISGVGEHKNEGLKYGYCS